MYTSQYSPDFWWRMAIFLIGTAVVIFIVNAILRKLLGVKRKSLFSYNHINETHRKIDWGIRLFMLSGILLSAIFAFESFHFYMLLIFLIFGAVQEIVRAAIEKKHAENPKDYLFTLIQLPILYAVIFGMAYFAFPDSFIELFKA